MYVLIPSRNIARSAAEHCSFYSREDIAISNMTTILNKLKIEFTVKSEGLTRIFLGPQNNELGVIIQR